MRAPECSRLLPAVPESRDVPCSQSEPASRQADLAQLAALLQTLVWRRLACNTATSPRFTTLPAPPRPRAPFGTAKCSIRGAGGRTSGATATPRSPLPPQLPPPRTAARRRPREPHGAARQHAGSAEGDRRAAAARCPPANARAGASSKSREGGRGAAGARQHAGVV